MNRECRELVLTALADARAVASASTASAAVSAAGAEQALAAAWVAVLAATKTPGSPTETAARLEALERIRQAEHALASERLRHRESSFGRLDEALGRLREGTSAGELIKNAADAVVHLGFDRAIVSAVRRRRWVPEWVSDQRDPAWSEEILQVGRTQPRVLDGQLVESQLVGSQPMGRKPGIIVTDVRSESRVHDTLVRIARTDSYIAVPLVIDGAVTGFLHADCYYQRRDLGETDTRMLSIFAGTLAETMGRNVDREHLAETRSGLRRLSGSLPCFGDEQPLIARRRNPRQNDPPPNGPGLGEAIDPGRSEFSVLSPRELDVVGLVAQGETNASIGRRLFISEGTVKSHVNKILRKLDASSRSEIVTRWFVGRS